MLRFAEKPDEIFLTLLSEAIDEAINFIEAYGEDADSFEAAYPLTSRHFTPTLASQTLQRLRTASEAEELYQLTDYHWELLYDVLKDYSELFKDNEVDSGLPNKYGIKEINFTAMIEKFFWDTDFMQDAETLLELTEEQKKALGMSKETFGLVQGFSPHPEELEIRPVPVKTQEKRVGDSSPRPPSPRYPF